MGRTLNILRIDTRVSRAAPRPTCIAWHLLAGTGAYELPDRAVVAVEPSTTMIEQRTAGSAPVVQATAMSLPFENDSFEAALAVLTVHHWPDKPRGLAELRRVARRRVVVLTWDPALAPFWLTDCVPELLNIDRRLFPTVRDFERAPGPVSVATISVPHDCSDGFLGAHWRRPSTYLDAHVRGAISTFSTLSGLESGLERLRADLASGEWRRKYGDLLDKTELDLGYQLIVACVPHRGQWANGRWRCITSPLASHRFINQGVGNFSMTAGGGNLNDH